MFSGELADHKLTWIKRRLQLKRRAQLRRRAHHQCCPRQGRMSHDRHGRRSSMGQCNLKLEIVLRLETDEQIVRLVLIPVLKEAEFPRRGPQRGRDGGTHQRRGASGAKNVHLALQGSEAFIGLTKALRARCHVRAGEAECRQGEFLTRAQRRPKETRRRS